MKHVPTNVFAQTSDKNWKRISVRKHSTRNRLGSEKTPRLVENVSYCSRDISARGTLSEVNIFARDNYHCSCRSRFGDFCPYSLAPFSCSAHRHHQNNVRYSAVTFMRQQLFRYSQNNVMVIRVTIQVTQEHATDDQVHRRRSRSKNAPAVTCRFRFIATNAREKIKTSQTVLNVKHTMDIQKAFPEFAVASVVGAMLMRRPVAVGRASRVHDCKHLRQHERDKVPMCACFQCEETSFVACHLHLEFDA